MVYVHTKSTYDSDGNNQIMNANRNHCMILSESMLVFLCM
jgi:hypothetical protein